MRRQQIGPSQCVSAGLLLLAEHSARRRQQLASQPASVTLMAAAATAFISTTKTLNRAIHTH
jgi:hypothetical protein